MASIISTMMAALTRLDSQSALMPFRTFLKSTEELRSTGKLAITAYKRHSPFLLQLCNTSVCRYCVIFSVTPEYFLDTCLYCISRLCGYASENSMKKKGVFTENMLYWEHYREKTVNAAEREKR